MKQYKLITAESLLKMSRCFLNVDEVTTFMTHLTDMIDEMHFQSLLGKRVDEDGALNVVMRQICIMALFTREHMELIHQLVASIESKDMSEDEIKDFKDKVG